MNHLDNLEYIKNSFGIEYPITSKNEASNILREYKINISSWILDTLANEYGEAWAASYRISIKDKICKHGFIDECPYCNWGTE